MSEVIGIVDHVLEMHAYYLTSRLATRLRRTTITKRIRFKLLIPFVFFTALSSWAYKAHSFKTRFRLGDADRLGYQAADLLIVL